MRTLGIAVVLGAILAGASSCNDANTASNPDGPVPAPAPYTPEGDVAYIDALVPHHEMALQMAEREIAAGSDPAVIAMAGEMRMMQMEEIKLLRSVRVRLTESSETPGSGDPHMDDDMARLEALSGEALDRAFLEDMVPHHSSAVLLSHRALPFLSEPELRTVATDTVINQAQEAGMMAAMLETLPPPGIRER